MEVIIVGAGIGGLGVALTLGRSRHKITVLEQAPALHEVGAGIQLGANGTRILDQWGLLESLLDKADAAPFGRLGDGLSGKPLCKFPLSNYAESRYQLPHLHLHRADLLTALLEACSQLNNIQVLTNSQVVHLQQEKRRAICVTEHGAKFDAELVIGADGMRSRIAESVFQRLPARFSGRVAWRALINMDQIDTDLDPRVPGVWMAPGKHLVHYPIRGGRLLNLVACANSSDRLLASWDNRCSAEQFLQTFGELAPNLQAMIAPLEESYLWGLYQSEPYTWVSERVVLLGDAAHTMLPSMAQGAAMALEDAAVLGQIVQSAAERDIAWILATYQKLRRTRASAVQQASLKNMEFFHTSEGWIRAVQCRGLSLLGDRAEQLIGRRYDWIYGFDASLEAAKAIG